MSQTIEHIIRPGPGRIAIQQMSESNEYQIPGSDKRLWVPSATNNEGVIGKVVAVCANYQSDSGVEFEPNYKLGDIIIIGKFTGTRLNIGRETYTILFEKDVLASINQEALDDAASVGT